jgi:hypothetical protein
MSLFVKSMRPWKEELAGSINDDSVKGGDGL